MTWFVSCPAQGDNIFKEEWSLVKNKLKNWQTCNVGVPLKTEQILIFA